MSNLNILSTVTPDELCSLEWDFGKVGIAWKDSFKLTDSQGEHEFSFGPLSDDPRPMSGYWTTAEGWFIG